MEIEWLRENIPLLSSAPKITLIPKGFSKDRKYVVLHDGTKYLLRIADIEEYERKNSEFHILSEIQRYDVECSKPIELGRLERFERCYYILSYIEGEEAGELLPLYSEQEQFQIGLKAGKELWKMHLHQAPQTISPWYDRVTKKHKNYLEAYRSFGIKLKNDEKIMTFIEENAQYIRNRPNQFQHDDFHVANIIVRDKQYAGVIDFNRYDWGDPYHDFCKVGLFSKEVSVPFSIGQVKGYFENRKVPEEFWRLYSVYIAMTVFSALVWTLRVTPDRLDAMKDRLYHVLEDHSYFQLIEPKWWKTADV